MKTKKFTSTVFALALGLGVAFGINYVSATPQGVFNGPPGTFPNCPTTTPGCNAPLNVGTGYQIKNGNLSVNVFTAYMNSEFIQNLQVDQLAVGSPDRSVCATASGVLVLCNTPGSVNVSASYNVSLLANGISGFNQPSPVTSANYNGTHNAFTGSVGFKPTWNTGTLPPGGVNVELLDNGVVIDCKLIDDTQWTKYNPSAQTDPFISRSYGITDSITVTVNSPGSFSPCGY